MPYTPVYFNFQNDFGLSSLMGNLLSNSQWGDGHFLFGNLSRSLSEAVAEPLFAGLGCQLKKKIVHNILTLINISEYWLQLRLLKKTLVTGLFALLKHFQRATSHTI